MYEVNLLQYYYLKMNNHNPKLNSYKNKINLINKLDDLKKFKNNTLLIANWSLSEFPLNFRKKFFLQLKIQSIQLYRSKKALKKLIIIIFLINK